MPESPVQEAPEGAPAEAREGGGIAEALTETDRNLLQINQALGSAPGVPEEAKALFAQALDSYRQGLELLTSGAGGGGEPAPGGAGAVTPEQGASGAVPVSHGRPM